MSSSTYVRTRPPSPRLGVTQCKRERPQLQRVVVYNSNLINPSSTRPGRIMSAHSSTITRISSATTRRPDYTSSQYATMGGDYYRSGQQQTGRPSPRIIHNTSTSSYADVPPSSPTAKKMINHLDKDALKYRSKSSPKQRPVEDSRFSAGVKLSQRSKTPQRLSSGTPVYMDEPSSISEHMVEPDITSRPKMKLLSTESRPSSANPLRNSISDLSMLKKSPIEPDLSSSKCRGVRGLTNLGNTCFMNACIQCLSNIPELRDYFLERRHERDLNTNNLGMKGQLAKDFCEVICQLWEPVNKSSAFLKTTSVSPTDFKKTISKWAPQFTGYKQQDSQEFLRFLLDGLHEDLNRVKIKPPYEELKEIEDEMEYDKANRWWDNYISRSNSFITDLFCGQLKSAVTCLSCKYVSVTFDPFMDISVPIPQRSDSLLSRLSSRRLTLQKCVDKFVETELLDDVYCSKCKKLRKVEKSLRFYRMPQVLVVHLKRFSSFNDKLLDEINFDENLDMRKYVDIQSQLHIRQDPAIYSIIGVTKHMGSVRGGHYTAECKHADSDEWMQFNDTSVNKTKHRISSSDYVLFFDRIKPR